MRLPPNFNPIFLTVSLFRIDKYTQLLHYIKMRNFASILVISTTLLPLIAAAASVTIPPMVPNDTEVSGFCCVSFNISTENKIKNVNAYTCTHDNLKEPVEKSVNKSTAFLFSIDDENSRPQNRQTRITIHITDERGKILYNPKIYIPKGVDPNHPKGWSKIKCNRSQID